MIILIILLLNTRPVYFTYANIPQAGQIMSMKPDGFYRNQRLMSDNDNSIASIGDGIRPISLIFKKLKLFP